MTSTGDKIDQILADHKVTAHVAGVHRGPTVEAWGIELGAATRVEQIERLRATIAVRLGYEDVRIVSPMPGTTWVGIEVPRESPESVPFSDFAEPACVQWEWERPLLVPLGRGATTGKQEWLDLATAPHLLVAGTTGSGKSVWLNAALSTIVSRGLDRVNLTLIDPKQVELTPYDDVARVVTDTDRAVRVVSDLVDVMEDRYTRMRDAGVRHADELSLPYELLVVDELADLVMQDRAVEKHLVRLAQKGRAARMHMILATQRPTKDVVTGLLKSNISTRLAFAVSATVDSMVVLDQPGAQALQGRGDGLILRPGDRRPLRIQAPLIDVDEVDELVERAHRRTVRAARPAEAHPCEAVVAQSRRRRDRSLTETEEELRRAARGEEF